MNNLKYKELKLIILLFFLVSLTQIVIIPLSKFWLQRILFYPLPEGQINLIIKNICDKSISKNANIDSIIGYLCSQK